MVIVHTSTPSLKNDCKVAEAIKKNRPETSIGFVGAHAAEAEHIFEDVAERPEDVAEIIGGRASCPPDS